MGRPAGVRCTQGAARLWDEVMNPDFMRGERIWFACGLVHVIGEGWTDWKGKVPTDEAHRRLGRWWKEAA